MTDREKLVNILKTEACPYPYLCDEGCRYASLPRCFEERYADYLLAHGVVVREKGEWIHDGQRIHNGVDWWHCSKCDKPAAGVEIKYNFCPNCGADMRKGENDG